MSADRDRWDARYAGATPREVPRLLVDAATAIGDGSGKRALDLACGDGAAAAWLAGCGFTVTALDVSPVALALARRRRLAASAGPIAWTEQDLRGWDPGAEQWDVVVCLRYLDRDLLAAIRRAVRPRGIALIEVLADPPAFGGAAAEPGGRFRADAGELLRVYADWHVLRYEAWPGTHVASLVARRPG